MNQISFFEYGRKRSTSNLLTNLVAYYKLDNNANDSTGLSPNGTTTGITYVAGKTGNAAQFNATTDTIDVADTNNLSFTDGVNDIPVSMSMWVYFDTDIANPNILLYRADTIGSQYEWTVSYDGTSSLLGFRFDKFTDSTNSQGVGTSSFTPTLNTWYHLVVTDDGSKTNAGMKIYVNGVSQTLSNDNTGTYTGTTNTVSILRMGQVSFSTASTINLKGYLEDVGIWKNRVLNSTEVNQLYNSGNGITYPF